MTPEQFDRLEALLTSIAQSLEHIAHPPMVVTPKWDAPVRVPRPSETVEPGPFGYPIARRVEGGVRESGPSY